jgi:hypothetical protein
MTTYSDLIEHLLAYGATDATRAASGQHLRAVQMAYQVMPTRHSWNYYWTLGRVTTSAPYSTGTVAFDLTGGANERQLTLTDGVWPAWAASGYVVISEVAYTVATRVSDTILTLAEASSPAADVAADTAYQLLRDSYPLPTDFVASDEPVLGTNGEPVEYRHARGWATRDRWARTGRPTCFAYTGSPTRTGQLQIVFGPPPDAAYAVDFVYRRKPRPLVFDGPQTGLASVAADGVTVTGSGTAFRAAMVGSVLRLGVNNKVRPTGLGGLNPRAHEAVITAVASATSLTVDDGPAEAASQVMFTVSDPADVDEVAMLEFLFRECEQQWRAVSRSSGGPLTTAKAEQQEYSMALTRAMEADGTRYGGRRAALRDRLGTGWRGTTSHPEDSDG